MNVYLAGQDPAPFESQLEARKRLRPMILESFLQVNDKSVQLLPYYESYMLDSGAFSWLNGTLAGTQQDFKKYIDRYIRYVVDYDVKLFMEFDVDKFIGYPKVLEIREYINKETGRNAIPVWHVSRGLKDFHAMCERYDYVAIGGMCTKEIPATKMNVLPQLIRDAHTRKAKIHGLGFTRFSMLPTHHFDSVDSTAWLSGNRFGCVYQFDGKTMQKVNKPAGKRMVYKNVAVHNFAEWVKFQKWAKVHL